LQPRSTRIGRKSQDDRTAYDDDGSEDAELNLHRLGEGVFEPIQRREQIVETKIVDIELISVLISFAERLVVAHLLQTTPHKAVHPNKDAVAPIQAVDTKVICGVNTGTKLATKVATVKLPSNPHRPRVLETSPPCRVARRNQPNAKPPAAETQYLAKVKKKTPIAAPKKEEMMQARR